MQACPLQIEPIAFHIAEHFFNPGSAPVSPQSSRQRRQISRQQPGFLFSGLPDRQQVSHIGMPGGQFSWPQPELLTRSLDYLRERLPAFLLGKLNQIFALLAQYILPIPVLQLAQHLHRPKFAVPNHQDWRTFRQQSPHVTQQRQLHPSGAVATGMSNPSPDLFSRTVFHPSPFSPRKCSGMAHICRGADPGSNLYART